MVAHTGNIFPTIKACETVDHCLSRLVPLILDWGGTVIITGDHGNAEELITYETTSFFFTTGGGKVNTEHSNNPVPVVFVNNDYTGRGVSLTKGSLADVAPTILAMMGLSAPVSMSGRNLLTSTAPGGKPS